MDTQDNVIVFQNLTVAGDIANYGKVVEQTKPAKAFFVATNAAGPLRNVAGYEEVKAIAKASGEALRAALK